MNNDHHEEIHPLFPWMTLAVRGWLYRVMCAVAALLIGIGVVTAGDASHWVLLGAAVLGVGGNGLASRHSPTTTETSDNGEFAE